jgi:hypothetical protein
MGEEPPNLYRFASRWTLAAPVGRVFGVLEDVDTYPRWWPQVRSVRRLAGDRAAVECRSVLPYTLRFLAMALEHDRPAGRLRVALSGDLDGFAAWTLHSFGEHTELRYDQEVLVNKALVRGLGAVVRPVLVLNHQVMMRAGRHGLIALLARPVGDDRT